MWPISGLVLEMVIGAVCASYPQVTGAPPLTGRQTSKKKKKHNLPLNYIYTLNLTPAYPCRINSAHCKNRNHCDISRFCGAAFAYSVGFVFLGGFLADIYLLRSVFPTNVWPLEDVAYEVLH